MFKGVLTLLGFILITFMILLSNPGQALANCSPAISSPNLTISKATSKGAVNLSWNQITGANRYALVYGYQNMDYMFGSLNIDGGTQTKYTVMDLGSNKPYSFQIWAFCSDDQAPTVSNQVNTRSS